MDVRCEKCQTVYEFDDARVKDTGVTVKYTQCGHIFKVRKKTTPPTAPPKRPTLPAFGPVDQPTPPPAPVPTLSRGQRTGPRPEIVDGNTGSDQRVWLLRGSDGEVRKFRELTTLQQWIVEKKAHRDDEISKNGEVWKRIGGIADLAPFFRIVEQAAAAGVVTPAAMEDAYLSNSSPTAASGGEVSQRSPARNPTPLPSSSQSSPDWRSGPTSLPDAGAGFGEDDTDLQIARTRIPGAAFLVVAAAALLVGVVGYVGVYKRAALRNLIAGDEGSRGREAYRKGREYFLLDTDEDFHRADQQLQRAQGADETNPLPVAALVEVNVNWARDLRDDALRAAERDPARAEELRREAQAHLDDAKRFANEARMLAADDPDVNRALADFLCVDGAPTPQVEENLRRSAAKRSEDPELLFVRGALALRDGKPDDAQVALDQATRLNQKLTQHDLLRADYLLATMAAGAGRKTEANAYAQRILETNVHHERARTLIAALGNAAPTGTALPAAPPVAGGVAARPMVTPIGEPQPIVKPLGAAPTAPLPTALPTLAPPVAVAAAPVAIAAPPVAVAAAPAVAPPPAVAAAPAAEPVVTPTPIAGTPGMPNSPIAGTPGTANSPATAPAPVAPKPAKPEPKGYQQLVDAADKLLERGKGKDAVKLFEKALAEQPGGVEALNGLGYAYLDTEHFSAAVDQFKKALESSPGNGEAILGIAQTYKARGDKTQALEYYERYLKELPHGSKADMAKANVNQLQAAGSP